MPLRPSHRVRLPLLALALAALVVATTATVAAEPAAPALVGLGDSYASGLGTGDYDGASGDCKRSPKAYAPLVAQQMGAALTFVACSGSTTDDVQQSQLAALSSATTDVTLTVGGNDIGFVDVISTCALSNDSACFAAIEAARALIVGVLPGRLDDLYSAITTQAPNAEVFVLGYPPPVRRTGLQPVDRLHGQGDEAPQRHCQPS